MTLTSQTTAETSRERRADLFSHVGRGTPMGTYLRYFWYPIAAEGELDDWPVKKVRLLGEDLALWRSDDGRLGLIADRCPHRGASLSCGMTDGPNLRCAYHGWAFDRTGNCTDTPAEPTDSRLKERIKTPGYPVEALGGLIWAYLGALPSPLLPRYEALVRDDRVKELTYSDLPCNWLQVAENSVDSYHLEHLHLRFLNWARAKKGLSQVQVRKHAKVDYEPFDYGILKKRLWEGDSEDSHEWRVGHPLLFPAHLFVQISPGWVQFQFRVPVDDENTQIYWYDVREPRAGETCNARLHPAENPWCTPDGQFMPERVNVQDMMVWVTQGRLTDRVRENLGESDRGIALLRRLLLEDVEKAGRGDDPRGVIRNTSENTPHVRLPIEGALGFSLGGVQSSSTYTIPG